MLSKRERIILVFTSGVIIFSLMLNFVLIPVINRFQALNKEIALGQLNLNKSLRLLSKQHKIQQDYDQIASVAQLQTGGEEIFALVLSQLQQLSDQTGLRIIDVRPQASRDLGRYKQMVIELKQEGKIEGFLKFIYGLETPPYLLKINTIQLNSKATREILLGRLIISKIYLPSEKP